LVAPLVDTAEVTHLGLDLFRSVLDGQKLLPALAPLAARLRASSHMLHLVRYRDGRPTGSRSEGLGNSAEMRAAYADHWVRFCPRARAVRAANPGVHHGSDLVPVATWRASRFWAEWGRPSGAGFHTLTVLFRTGSDSTDSLAFHRREDEAPFSAADHALLQSVFGDLRRAFEADTRLAAAREGPEEAARRGLEAMADGIALLDADRGLVFANPALRRMAAQNDGIRLGADGVEVQDPALRLALSRAVTAALAAAAGKVGLLETAGTLAIPRPSGRAHYLLRALPVLPQPGSAGFRGAMLQVVDGARTLRINPALLARMFGLTPAEAALAGALAAGRSLAEHAARRGVSVETARSHMAAIRRKTGCRRQADLAALLARLPG
jgi:DNA-binding CsgD family transcriptional regulator/PAS domain-containing protein